MQPMKLFAIASWCIQTCPVAFHPWRTRVSPSKSSPITHHGKVTNVVLPPSSAWPDWAEKWYIVLELGRYLQVVPPGHGWHGVRPQRGCTDFGCPHKWLAGMCCYGMAWLSLVEMGRPSPALAHLVADCGTPARGSCTESSPPPVPKTVPGHSSYSISFC